MVTAYLAFRLPAETQALDAAVRAVEHPSHEPVLVNGNGNPAGTEANGVAAAAELDDTPPSEPPVPPAPVKRAPGRPRKAAAVVEARPEPIAALPVPRVINAPVTEARPDPDAAEDALRQELGFEALRVCRIMSVPAMRSLLQKVGGEDCMSVADVPAPLLGQALAEFKATA